MNRRILVILGAVAVVFVIAVVGASSINLAGSDSAPGESTTVATCVQDLVVKTPIDTTTHDDNKVRKMVLTGDLSDCVGETLRAEVNLSGENHAYAVYKITSPVSELTLTFDEATGNFYDTKPTVAAGDLVDAGAKVGPISVSDFGMTTITIAKTWE
jgi:hypothetical protein